MSCRPFLTILVLVAAGTFPGETGARTWDELVDGSGDSPTIQAGIDSAAVGDTVLVHPGTYNEVIDFLGKDIVVKSAAGPEVTVLDGSGSDWYVVLFQSGETRGAIIEGLTITGGLGGILIYNSEASIINNIITGNNGTSSGAGMWMVGEPSFEVSTFRPLIIGNIITHNVATLIAGGVGTWQRMAPEIIDNYIAENEATEGDGGGIFLRLHADDVGSVIRGNVIEKNHVGDHGGGFYSGGVLAHIVISFELSWNVINDNTSNGIHSVGSNSGGGAWLSGTDSWIHHNTIVGNTGNGPDSVHGGGVVVEKPGTPIIEKNIIALSQNGGGIWCGGGATPTIRNNLAWENLPENGVGDCPTWWQADGNIVDAPAFCDAENGNYAVAQNSPAMTHPAGPLGAIPLPGCGPVSVQPTTWGLLKSRYLPGN